MTQRMRIRDVVKTGYKPSEFDQRDKCWFVASAIGEQFSMKMTSLDMVIVKQVAVLKQAGMRQRAGVSRTETTRQVKQINGHWKWVKVARYREGVYEMKLLYLTPLTPSRWVWCLIDIVSSLNDTWPCGVPWRTPAVSAKENCETNCIKHRVWYFSICSAVFT